MITIKIRHEHLTLGFEKEKNKMNSATTNRSSDEETTISLAAK